MIQPLIPIHNLLSINGLFGAVIGLLLLSAEIALICALICAIRDIDKRQKERKEENEHEKTNDQP